MSRYLLDTDTITLVQFDHSTAIRNLSAHSDSEITLSVVSFQEQMKGRLNRFNKLTAQIQQADWYERLVSRIWPVWRRFEILPFPVQVIQRFEHLRSLRLNVGMMDLRIASAALENNLIVVSRNRRDFARVPGLTVEDWTQ